MNAPTWLRAVTGELLGSALLVIVMFGSGAVRMQLGAATMPSAMLGSLALGLGYGLVIWSFGGLEGAPPLGWIETALRCAPPSGAAP